MMLRSLRRGSTLVEGAVTLVVFLVVLVGIFDVGQVLFFHHFLNDRARTGARYAVVHEYDPTVVKNIVAYNSADPSDRGGMLGLKPSMVQVNRYDAGTVNDRIKVSINSYQMHFISPYLMKTFTPGPFVAVMPVESSGSAP